MKLFPNFRLIVTLVCAGLCAGSALAQRPGVNALSAKPASGAYDISKDVSLQGTVLSFTENSQTPPLGAHVMLQTTAGNVDVHLGDTRFLRLAKLNISPGANVRIVGQMTTVGKNQVFLGRLVQVGAQVVAVRSDHGLPLGAAGLRANKALLESAQAEQKGGAR
ncbi:MAG TPA: hypothetical protein VM781_00320 [Candidatus Bathyarchaeia archaeon]|nr:hypothetical protein [Candidatus Bathyarchaeia archaeon]